MLQNMKICFFDACLAFCSRNQGAPFSCRCCDAGTFFTTHHSYKQVVLDYNALLLLLLPVKTQDWNSLFDVSPHQILLYSGTRYSSCVVYTSKHTEERLGRSCLLLPADKAKSRRARIHITWEISATSPATRAEHVVARSIRVHIAKPITTQTYTPAQCLRSLDPGTAPQT